MSLLAAFRKMAELGHDGDEVMQRCRTSMAKAGTASRLFRWLESKAYKMHVRVLLSRYRIYKTCPDCHGARSNRRLALSRRRIDAGDFYRLTVRGPSIHRFGRRAVEAFQNLGPGQAGAGRGALAIAYLEKRDWLFVPGSSDRSLSAAKWNESI